MNTSSIANSPDELIDMAELIRVLGDPALLSGLRERQAIRARAAVLAARRGPSRSRVRGSRRKGQARRHSNGNRRN